MKIKYRGSSILKGLLPAIFRKYDIVLDVFIKYKDTKYTYWRVARKNMKVDTKYYRSYESLEFKGYSYKVPNNYKDYLTQKYGDWNVVRKEWHCGRDEKIIMD